MNYVFLDLETTGLDPEINKIIEIGIVVTDEAFFPINCFSRVVKTVTSDWENVVDVVDQMHSNNDLKHQSLAGYAHTLQMVEEAAGQFLMGFPWDDHPPMCGNTVHFDREFIRRHMPQLFSGFHYRTFDVSSLKQMARNIAPGLPFPGDDDETHRALPDALMSAREMGICRRLFFEGLYSLEPQDTVVSNGEDGTL